MEYDDGFYEKSGHKDEDECYFDARGADELMKPPSGERLLKQQRLMEEAWEEYEEGIANDPNYLEKALAEEREFSRKYKKSIPDPATPGLRFLVTKAHGIKFIIDIGKVPDLSSDRDEEQQQLGLMFKEAEKRAESTPDYFHTLYEEHIEEKKRKRLEEERKRLEWENSKRPGSDKTHKEERDEKARFFKEWRQLLYEIRETERRIIIREQKEKEGLEYEPNFEKIKIGRCCYTCTHRTDREGSSYIICECNNYGHKIWEKAHCALWELTTDPDRLSQYEKYSDTKNLLEYRERDSLYGNTSRYDLYYRKTNDLDADEVCDQINITLGQCCFLCHFRTSVHRTKVHCSTFDKKVWGKAKCRYFSQTKEFERIERFKKYMKKSNIDVSGATWRNNQSTMTPEELQDYKVKRVKRRE